MNPQEKAKELFNKYGDVKIFIDMEPRHIECKIKETDIDTIKQCALIAVQEILNCNPHTNPFNTDVYSTYDYWFQVKLEIEKL